MFLGRIYVQTKYIYTYLFNTTVETNRARFEACLQLSELALSVILVVLFLLLHLFLDLRAQLGLHVFLQFSPKLRHI